MKEEFEEVPANIHHFERWVSETEATSLKAAFSEILEQAGFSVVGFTEHHFPVRGYTCVWLLAESHLAVHTFPADQKTFVQLSSCNEIKAAAFARILTEFENKIR